ncbi:Uncharacterised protein [[Clostridium] sordellii]|uniref:hypothetical protein n=1 Tax=Paraclostridium sordellii TaxID=1505 RepID=UPI0005DB1F81|nr:hypothetical protein [Paeniclostridium sordellii]CEP46409.1 Uncharacterised protein [[Clostridium] sordellii] [Paeniclostridium sordellii]
MSNAKAVRTADKEYLPTKDVVLVTLGGINIKTADEYEAEPEISEGEKVELVVTGELIASDEAPTIVKGYNLKFKDNAIRPKLMEKLQGGKFIAGNSPETEQKYEGPAIGALKPTAIGEVCVYTKVYAENGFTGEYIKTTYENCIGDLVNFSFKSGNFFASEFTVKSRPSAGQPSFKLELVKSLPEE